MSEYDAAEMRLMLLLSAINDRRELDELVERMEALNDLVNQAVPD